MLKVFSILLTGTIISFMEIRPYIKGQQYKDVIVFFVFLFIGLTLNILIVMEISIPNPVEFLSSIYTPISNLVDQLLS